MAIEQDAFLAVCFRNLASKPDVDFEKVAEETGMSLGGARYVHYCPCHEECGRESY